VAQRLADAVPGVVDCDRVSVYVWSDELGRLERRALNAADDAGLHSVRPQDVPQLASWLEQPDPEPLFIDIDSSAVKVALREIGAVAAVAVPIATDERFLGCFVVSAMDRPERLVHSPELVDRLSGVAAQALIALENGRLVDRITHQARHDQLTGVANRAGFHEQLAAATAGDATLALFYVDLDQFKPINDVHGHQVGDAVLRAVAQRLSEHLRAGDTVARIGGDEFAVLVGDVADPAQLAAISERLAHAFDRPLTVGGRSFAIRASIGRAVWPVDGQEPEALLRTADAAMYDNKRRARAVIS
jgi:diguanylate cyclase (GGDEF)-like protein